MSKKNYNFKHELDDYLKNDSEFLKRKRQESFFRSDELKKESIRILKKVSIFDLEKLAENCANGITLVKFSIELKGLTERDIFKKIMEIVEKKYKELK